MWKPSTVPTAVAPEVEALEVDRVDESRGSRGTPTAPCTDDAGVEGFEEAVEGVALAPHAENVSGKA